MSLVKKSDVKNHLSPHHRKGIHLTPPVSQPDATGFSEDGSRTDMNGAERIQQPSSVALEAPVTSPDSHASVVATSPKSTQG